MDVDDGNLMDALMKAVAQGRPKQVEWSGMQVTEVTQPLPRSQPWLKPASLPAELQPQLEITEVAVAQRAIQYTFF